MIRLWSDDLRTAETQESKVACESCPDTPTRRERGEECRSTPVSTVVLLIREYKKCGARLVVYRKKTSWLVWWFVQNTDDGSLRHVGAETRIEDVTEVVDLLLRCD